MGTWQSRLFLEASELTEKIAKLREFLASPNRGADTAARDAEAKQRELMRHQLKHMESYGAVLKRRISALDGGLQ